MPTKSKGREIPSEDSLRIHKTRRTFFNSPCIIFVKAEYGPSISPKIPHYNPDHTCVIILAQLSACKTLNPKPLNRVHNPSNTPAILSDIMYTLEATQPSRIRQFIPTLEVSLNYCSQNGGKLYRAPYYNRNLNIGPRIDSNLGQSLHPNNQDPKRKACALTKTSTLFGGCLQLMPQILRNPLIIHVKRSQHRQKRWLFEDSSETLKNKTLQPLALIRKLKILMLCS